MRIILLILVPPILLFLFALLTMLLPLPQPFPPAQSGARTRIAAILTGVLGLGYLVYLAVYVVGMFRRAGRNLDPLLTAAGLAPSDYMAFGRQYCGSIDGREVEVVYIPSRWMSPAQVDIRVRAKLRTGVAIGRDRPLLDCDGRVRLSLDEPELRHLQIYAEEEASARAILGDPAASAALRSLMDDPVVLRNGQVYLQPERVWLRVRPYRLSEEQVRHWLDDSLALARAGERALGSSE